MSNNNIIVANKAEEKVEYEKCSECNGTGTIMGCCMEDTCHICGGTGWIKKQ